MFGGRGLVVVPKHQVLSRKMSKNIINRNTADWPVMCLGRWSYPPPGGGRAVGIHKMDLKKRAARYRMLLCQHL
jgi:hypothetical protein